MKLILISPEHLGQPAGLGTPPLFNTQFVVGEKVSILLRLRAAPDLVLLGLELPGRN